ncbi:MAG: hypothetical protein R2788_16260 [Saprospiraceae bacterium]
MEEGVHFYLENGLYVFMEKYHLKKGTVARVAAVTVRMDLAKEK